MPRLPIVIAILGLALAGCSQQAEEAQTQASAAAAAKAAVQAMRPQPGKYRVTTKITKVTIPGLPPEAAAQAAKMFATTGHSSEFCLTAEQVSLGYEEMTKRAAHGKCRFERFSAVNGRLDSAMTCEIGRGMTIKSQATGTITPTGSNLSTVSDSTMPGMPGGGMHAEGTTVTERLGDCP